MKTKTARKIGAKSSKTTATQDQPVPLVHEDADMQHIDIELIDPSPLNYRKFYDQKAMEEFAQELSQHGIISAVTVRVVTPGRYELVAGERRYHGAKLAKLHKMPAMVRSLTDEQVIEMQLAENIQREDPHPLHEAHAIEQLLEFGHTTDEIALKLGRSKSFIHSRIKLAGLIEGLKLVFLASKCSLQDAIAIAILSPSAQEEFFAEHCQNWERENFRLSGISSILDRFRYDLIKAPFDTHSTELVPEAGACTKCPFNSAVLGSLFPEMEKRASCTNKSCYQQKCNIQFTLSVEQVVNEYNPVAIICHRVSNSAITVLEELPSTKDLPQHNWYSVSRIEAPTPPAREDYFQEDETFDDEEQDMQDDAEKLFDEQAFNEAVYEYEQELADFQEMVSSGKAQIGLSICEYTVGMMLFTDYSISMPENDKSKGATSKMVQQAIKLGTATPELITGEIARLQQREERAKEIDRDKVQLKIHEQFIEKYQEVDNNTSLTNSDMVAARLIIFDSLDYYARNKFSKIIFPENENSALKERELMYKALCELSEQKFVLLVRMALANKSESKLPWSGAAYTLYKAAEESGLDVASIETEQKTIADARQDRMEARVSLMEKQLEKAKTVVSLEVEG